ncbi:MAG: transglycosylase domain-containing protein [Eubacteriales bacterium]
MNFSKENNKKKQEKLKSKKHKIGNKINISFFRVLILGILLIAIIGVGTVLGAVKGIIDSAPNLEDVNIAPEGYTSIVYDQQGNEIVRLVGENSNRIYKEIDEIPEHVHNAFVAIEDERFWTHSGIDLKGIMRATFINIKEGDLSEGASTLTQQLIKNNVLSKEKSFKRKIQEQYLAIELEKEYSKEIILEHYLNTISLGQGTLGVQAAAFRYFNKDISELTIAESAVLAAITQRPEHYNPTKNPDNNQERQRIILKKMLEQEYITQEEYEEALNEDVYTNIQVINQEYDSGSSLSYYVDKAIDDIAEDLQTKNGMTEAQAYNKIYRGGLKIYIAQDSEIQKSVDDILNDEENYPPKEVDYAVLLEKYRLSIKNDDDTIDNYDENTLKNYFKAENSNFDLLFSNEEEALKYVDEYKNSLLENGGEVLGEVFNTTPQPQASMVIMDYHNGHVKAISGGRGEKKGNQVLNRATDTYRQPGSTFKVLASFLPAIDKAGFTLASIQDDVPYQYPNGKNVKNWYDTSRYTYNFRGLSTIRQAISYSMNIVAVKTLEDIGPQLGYDYLTKLGFTSIIDKQEINGRTYSDIGLPLALGGVTKGVSNLELTAGYGAIANKGVYVEPIFYTKVLDHNGDLILENNPSQQTVMKETTSFLLTNAMEDVLEPGGTATQSNFGNMPIAGKTGTTSDDKDVWFSGYTPYYIGTIWMGYDNNKTLNYNVAYHKYLWRDVMKKIHDNLDYKRFERPSGIISVDICTESGKLAVPGLCDEDPRGSTIKTEYFASGTEPTEECDVHQKFTICTEEELFATEYCPEELTEERVYIVRPEPIDPSLFDPARQPRIEDEDYEYPESMEGEYCTIHSESDHLDDIPDFPDIPDEYINDPDFPDIPDDEENDNDD